MPEARQRRRVGEHVHVLLELALFRARVQEDLAPGLVLQARSVQALEAWDAEEPVGIRVLERLLAQHPRAAKVVGARAFRRRHGHAVCVHRLCQLSVDALLRSRDWPEVIFEKLDFRAQIQIFFDVLI